MPAEVFTLEIEIDGRKVKAQAREVKQSTDQITTGFEDLKERIAGMRSDLGELENPISKTTSGLRSWAGVAGLAAVGAAAAAFAVRGLTQSIEEARGAIELEAKLARELVEVGHSGAFAAKEARRLAQEQRSLKRDTSEATDGLAVFSEQARRMKEAVGRLLIPVLDSMGDSLDKLLRRREVGLATLLGIEELAKAFPAIAALRDALLAILKLSDKAKKGTKDYTREYERFSDAALSFREAYERSIAPIVAEEERLEGALRRLNRAQEESAKREREQLKQKDALIQKFREEAQIREEILHQMSAMAAAQDGPGGPSVAIVGPGLEELFSRLGPMVDEFIARTENEFGDALISPIEAAGEELKRLLAEGAKQFEEDLLRAARQFYTAIGDGLGVALAGALTGGDVRGALSSVLSNVSNLIASQITSQMGGGFGAGMLGGFAGGFFGFIGSEILGAITADKGPSTTAVNFQGSVGIFSGAVNVFMQGAHSIHEASKAMGSAARTVRGQIGDLESMLGGFFGLNLDAPLFPGGPPPGIGAGGGGGAIGDGGVGGGGLLLKAAQQMFANLTGGILGEMDLLVQQVGDQWTVNIQGLAGGMGDSLEEATRNMLDAFAQRLPGFIESGRITLEGIPAELVAVLVNSTAQTFDELRENLQIAVEGFLSSLGPIEADLFTFFSELSVAIREQIRVGLPMDTIIQGAFNQIQDFISSVAGVDLFPQFANAKEVLEAFGMQLQRLGIVGDEARVLMQRMATAIEIVNNQLAADLWAQIANTLAMMPGNAQLAADIMARAEQARALSEIAIAQINLETLLAMGRISQALFDTLNEALGAVLEWASDFRNFLVSAANSARTFASSAASAASSMTQAAAAAAESSAPSGQGPFARVMSILDSVAASLRPALDPIARVQEQFAEIFSDIEGINDEERRLRALARAQRLYNKALEQAEEALLGGLRAFRQSLDLSPFSGGFITDRVSTATDRFQELLQRALGGDASAVPFLQGSAQSLLQLAEQAFGTASAEFAAIRDLVFGGLDDVLSTDFVDPQVEATQAQTNAMIEQFDIQNQQQAARHREMVDTLKERLPLRQLKLSEEFA